MDRIIDGIDNRQRRCRPAAFACAVGKKFGEDHAGRLAAVIAYYAFFALMPLLLVFATVLAFILAGNADLQERVVDSALAQYPVIGVQIERNVTSIEGSGVALAVGVAGTLWAGLGAVRAAGHAFDAVWDTPMKDRPGFLVARLRALAILAIVGGGALVSTAVTSVSQRLDRGIGVGIAGILLGWLLNLAVVLVAFKVLTTGDRSWSMLLPGAVVGAVGWVVLHALGGWFIGTRLAGASEMYGTFAVVIVLLSWMHLQALVLLAAAEVNVVLNARLWPRSLRGRDPTDADERALRRRAQAVARRDGHLIEASVE